MLPEVSPEMVCLLSSQGRGKSLLPELIPWFAPSPFQGEGRGEGKSVCSFSKISFNTPSSLCQISLFQNRITCQPF